MRKKRIIKTITVLLIVSAIMMSAFSAAVSADEANASGAVRHVTSHDIAIVFDNSGSMYENESWCQALYAMEVFASMIDYDHDKLGIYPMGGKIKLGKNGPAVGDRFDISDKSKVKDIEQLYSESTAPTILAPAYTATEYLKKSNLDEKWLIVLTDGAFDYDKSTKEERVKKDADWLNKKLLQFAVDEKTKSPTGINVQYLGFAEASKLTGSERNHFYATNAKTGDELTGELVKICNKIFQRNAIAAVSSDGKFSIDVSMSSLIAFVQGKGATIKSLKSADGKDYAPSMDTKLEASTVKTGDKHNYPAPIADVAGHSVTYSDCPAGDYTLEFSGSNIQIFYDPNVIIKTELVDSDGNTVDLNSKVYPGDYVLNYALVDAVSKEDVTNSSLLTPVSLTAEVRNQENVSSGVPSGSVITLDADSNTEIDISGTFLKDYTISNSADGGAFKIDVQPPDIDINDLKVDVSVNNYDFGHKWYKYSNHEEWKPIRVDVSYQGQPLSDEVLATSTSFALEPKDKQAEYKVELIPGESAFNVYIGTDESGKYVQPDSGRYKFTANVNYIDKYGRTIGNKDSDSFEIQAYSSIWRWLIYIVAAAALALLALFILTRKAWPHKMTFLEVQDDASPRRRPITVGSRMTVVPVFNAMSVEAKKHTTLMKKFGKKANIYVEKVRVSPAVESFQINYIPYERGSDFCDSTGNPFKGVIGNNTQIQISYSDGRPELNGEIRVN